MTEKSKETAQVLRSFADAAEPASKMIGKISAGDIRELCNDVLGIKGAEINPTDEPPAGQDDAQRELTDEEKQQQQ